MLKTGRYRRYLGCHLNNNTLQMAMVLARDLDGLHSHLMALVLAMLPSNNTHSYNNPQVLLDLDLNLRLAVATNSTHLHNHLLTPFQQLSPALPLSP